MFRHPLYPPLSIAELEERDRLLSLCRGPLEGGPRATGSSPRISSSSSSSSSMRIHWGGVDGGKGRCKVRRSCLGFTADGTKVVAGCHDSLVVAAASNLSIHLNLGASGVGLVMPHPIHPELVAVGCQVSCCCCCCCCCWAYSPYVIRFGVGDRKRSYAAAAAAAVNRRCCFCCCSRCCWCYALWLGCMDRGRIAPRLFFASWICGSSLPALLLSAAATTTVS